MRRPLPERPRVFLGLLDFVGYLSAISNGLTALGFDSFVLHLSTNRFGHYGKYKSNPITRLLLFSRARFEATRGYGAFNPVRYMATALMLVATWLTVFWIAARFDVVYLKGGESLTQSQWDLKFFRALGIVTIAHFAGSDSRPPFLNGFHGKVMTGPELVFWSKKIRTAVDRTRDLFDYVIDNPLAGQYHRRQCVIGQCLGTVADMEWVEKCAQNAPERLPDERRSIRIVHAPSRAEVKGTKEIRAAISRLREEGCVIDYIEVENKTNAEAISLMASADIVIDELYSDSVGATVSSEAAVLAKPIVNGTYGVADLNAFLPSEALLPTRLVEPNQLLEGLRSLVLHAAERAELGRRARAFVVSRNTPKAMASRFLSIAKGEAPENWYFDPADVTYMAGVAGSKEEIRHAIRLTLDAGGPSALCLDDRLTLRDAIIRFAQEDDDLARSKTKQHKVA